MAIGVTAKKEAPFRRK